MQTTTQNRFVKKPIAKEESRFQQEPIDFFFQQQLYADALSFGFKQEEFDQLMGETPFIGSERLNELGIKAALPENHKFYDHRGLLFICIPSSLHEVEKAGKTVLQKRWGKVHIHEDLPGSNYKDTRFEMFWDEDEQEWMPGEFYDEDVVKCQNHFYADAIRRYNDWLDCKEDEDLLQKVVSRG